MSGRATRATMAIAKAKVWHVLHEYEHDANAESYGWEAVTALGNDPARVFKTLIVSGDRNQLVTAIVPVAASLNLKALASVIDSKKVALANPADAERATGYVLGGISPLGQRKRLLTVLDESALQFDTIFISAGRRGLELELIPSDLVELCQAKVAPIT
jgi:Cys-tRNA(Pro)/Cys-tRNA(Cys) deacylase